MGWAPPRTNAILGTWGDVVRGQYLRGELTTEEYEEVVESLLWVDLYDATAPPPHPVFGYQIPLQ